MALAILPLEKQHLDDAAALWIARYNLERRALPGLAEAALHPRRVADVLAQALAHPETRGLGAFQGGQLLGFLLGEPSFVAPTSAEAIWSRPRAARIRYAWNAAPGRESLLPELYGALAARWVARGIFAHYALVPAQRESLEAFSWVGFGVDVVRALREVAPIPRVALRPDIDLKQVGPEALDDLLVMADEMDQHLAASPSFSPYLPETRSGFRQLYARLLGEPGTALFFALQQERPVGFALLHPASPQDAELGPECAYLHRCFASPSMRGTGVGLALVDRVMGYARLKGYTRCALSWRPSNLLADRFWRRCGFIPYQLRMLRVVDERANWLP